MTKKQQPYTLLLIADGFDELMLVTFLIKLREAGLAVKVVSLRSRRVNGQHGLGIFPDASLDEILEKPPPLLAVILGAGASCLTRLESDPRVVTLIQKSISDEVILVVLETEAKHFVERQGNLFSTKIISLNSGLNLETLVDEVTETLLAIWEV